MLGFKGRIARRRASGLVASQEQAAVSALRIQTGAPGIDLAGGDTPSLNDAGPVATRTQDDRNLETIRAGLLHVPDPDQAQHAPVPPTMESNSPRTTQPATSPRIWDMDPVPPAPSRSVHSGSVLARCAEAPTGRTDYRDMSAPEDESQTPPAFRADRRSSAPRTPSQPVRARTRLLGFHGDAAPDVFADRPAAAPGAVPRFPVGWLIVVEGPGRGASFALTAGLSSIGRDAGQTVSLNFGDDAISREGHMSIAHDDTEGRTWVGHGGKANIVRLNDRPLLSTEELNGGDTLRIGKTLLRYVALCGQGFSWEQGDAGAGDA